MLPLLLEPDHYVACALDLGANAEFRAYWLDLFRNHFPSLMEEAFKEATWRGEEPAGVRFRCDAATRLFYSYLDELHEDPSRYGRLDIRAICLYRETVLRQTGFDDPYRLTKAQENDAALTLLPSLLAELDQTPARQLPRRLIDGVFAGNVFDLGVETTLELFQSGGVDFHEIRAKLKPRPWLIDDLDAWVDRLLNTATYQRVVLFVDNAGCDIVLGMIPLARYLLSRGTAVVLTANSTASLNDITHAELVALIESIAAWDSIIGRARTDGALELIPSGNTSPLIDLTQCSPELVNAIDQQGADLIVLEGMGRSLESNYVARFSCDTLKIAMIKDQGVARAIGGEVYDLVLRFEPTTG